MRGLSTQRLAARAMLSLPSSVLRLLAGGGVVHRAGRTLDPRLQFLAAQARRAPPLQSLTPEEARRSAAALFDMLTGEPEPGVRWETLSIPGAAGEIAARRYRPAVQDPRIPLMVWAHMGGGVLGGLETSHAFCAMLAGVCQGPVLSVDYRLAPEHRFPAGLEDMLAAFRWGRDHAADFGGPPGQAAIGGDSIGGGFAAVICQDLKRAGEPQPALQVLVYPALDVASQAPSMSLFADAFPLTRSAIDWFVGHYVPSGDDPSDPRLSPLKTSDPGDLAPAVIATAGFDPVVDQGEAYARALKASGVPVAYRRYDSLCHAFAGFTGAVPAAEAACREIAALVREGLEGRLA